jgi:phage shock protein PspC (stress-responsive transcriptional regulator)
MMSTTTPEPDVRPAETGEGTLRRAGEGRMLTGVCEGLGRYAGIDPVLIRVGFAVLVLGSGIGFFLYIAAFLLMSRDDGGPGYAEQWTGRRFDAQTVLALLAAVLAFGLVMNLVSDTTGPRTVVVGTVIAIALLTARGRGVDLIAVARSLPTRAAWRRAGRIPDAGVAAAAPAGAAQAGGGTTTQDADPTAAAVPPRQASPHPADAPDAPAAAPAPEHGAAPRQEPGAPEPARSGTPAEPVPGAAPEAPAGTAPDHPGAPGGAVPDGPDAAPASSAARTAPPPPGATDPTVVLPPPSPAGATAGGTGDGYRRLRDLADEARYGYAAHEPFAPHGPYHSPGRYPDDTLLDLEAAGPGHGLGPGYGQAGPPAPPAPRRPRSFVGTITILVALVVGGIMAATQPSGPTANVALIGGAVLVTIGAGLLVTAWFGRGVGLIAAGTLVSCLLIASTAVGGVPHRIGSYTWVPATTAEALIERYDIGIGDGTLDLTEIEAAPGSRTRFDLRIAVGELRVIVPPAARAEVDVRVRIGDVTVGRTTRGGTDLAVTTVLEPEEDSGGPPPVFELHIRADLGDVEVRHG